MHEASLEPVDDDGLQVVKIHPEILNREHEFIGDRRITHRTIVRTNRGG